MSFRPKHPSRGRRGHGRHGEYWPPPQHPQNMHYDVHGDRYYQSNQGWTNNSAADNHGRFVSPHRHQEYMNQFRHGHRTRPAQTQRPSWHQPQENFYPRSPAHPFKRPKVEYPEDSSDRQTSHNQNPRNQTSVTSNHMGQRNFRSLEQQVKIEEPYYRCDHEIQDVLRVTNSDNIQNISSRSSNDDTKLEIEEIDIAVNNLSSELGRNSYQSALIIDLTNDDDDDDTQPQGKNRAERDNKENTHVHNIVCEPTQVASKNKETADSAVNTATSQAITPLVLRKSIGSIDNWSVQRPTVSNGVNSGAMGSPRTNVNPSIENNNLEFNNSIRVVPSSSTSNSSSKAQDPIENHAAPRKENSMVTVFITLDECTHSLSQLSSAKDTALSSSNKVHETVGSTSTSRLAAEHKKNKPGPRSSKSHSYLEKIIQDSAVLTQQSISLLESNIEEERNQSECAINEDFATHTDSNRDHNSSHRDDSNSSNPDAAADAHSFSGDLVDEGDTSKSSKSGSSENNLDESKSSSAATNVDVGISSDSSSEESDTEESVKSNSSDEFIPPSSKVLSLPCKRKDQDSEIFRPNSKKPRPILESDESDDDIIISDAKNEQEAVNPLPSTSQNSFSSNEKSKLEKNVPVSKATIAKLNNSSHYKLSSVKSTKRVDVKSVCKSVTSKSEDNIKQFPSSCVKKRTLKRVHKSLPISSLSNHQEGKQSHIINSRKLVVLLKRLSPHEISKFSAPKNIVDKSAVLYQKDVLYQIKYFISFVEYLSKNYSKISLMTHLDNPKDLCNQLLYYSNRSECALVELKYLQSEHSKITYKSLSNPEFDLKKMYKSFLDFRKNSNQKLNQFTIFTNFQLAIDNLKSNKVNIKHENDRYYLSVKEGHELHKKFVKSLTLYNLAELLCQCIQQRKQKNFNTELIKKYHLALVNENVLEIRSNKNSKRRQIHEANFNLDFIRNTALSDAAKELRRHMTDIMRSEPNSNMGFELTDPFGKDTNLDPDPQIDSVDVADALLTKHQAKLSILKGELKKIVGHVLEKIQNNIFGISKQFLKGTDLPGNLKQLRRQVKLCCDHKKIDFMKFCRDYRISIEDFCNDYPVHRLPNENGKKLFEEFFNVFNFANIRKHINLNNDIKKIDDEVCLNAVQKEILSGLTSEDLSKETFDSVLKIISKNNLIRISHKHPQPTLNVEFHNNVIDIFQKKLPKRDIVLCVTKCVSLTNLIVKQLSAKLNYTENKECLFVTNQVLLEMTSDVLNTLADKSLHLLVVQWNEPMEKNTKVLNVFGKLKNAIRNESAIGQLSMKSIIVIVHSKDFPSNINTMFLNKITDEEHLFELSEDSRVKLLQAENMSLQNRRLSLTNSEMILDEHVPILLESAEVLSELLTGKLIIGKNLVKPDGYKESLFKTQIKQCIIINPAIFHEQIDDVFIIRNIDRKDLEQYLPPRQKVLAPNDLPASMRINGRYILLGFNISQSFFDDYAEKNRDHDVHLLRYESDSFVWEKTSGNNKDLLRNRLGNIDDLLKSQKIEDVVSEGPKTIIICSESGSGKSVCLYNLAKETRNMYKIESIDAYWPVQVNLDKFRLSKHIKKNINMALEKDFVAEFLCDYLQLDAVQSKILTMIFKNQLKIKLSLFFDNYEELPVSHRVFIIKLLQELQVSYCEKIYVTSTPSTRSELEDALAVFSYTLEFSEVEKLDLLLKLWSKSFGGIELLNKAGNFIDYYSKSETNDDDLTTTPLHLKMLAGMCKPNDEDYIRVEAYDELYKLYIKHKGVKDIESACLYSLHKILNESQLKTLNLHHKYPKKGFILPNDLRHRTFYEYFLAKWLGTHNHSLTNSNFINLLDSVSPLFLKTYLAELNTSDDIVKIVGDFAANGHLNHLKMMLAHCKGKLLLSTIIRSNSPNARQSIRFLLDHYNDTKDEIMLHGTFKKKKYAESNVVKYVNRREKPKKETPLEVAAQMNNIPIACELLLKGANVEGIDKEFITDVVRYIANEMCKTDSEWLHPIAEKMLKLRTGAVAHLDKTKKYPRLLSYFYVHGRAELINLLLKDDRERYDILMAKVDNKSPLDLVNESRALSDDQRLDIAKYIVSNVGDDLERRNKYYLADVLKAAAECNHERTFEYFVGKYPDKHMGFLESAMKSNRLDLIRFLMRKTDRMMYADENTALHKAVSLGVSLSTIKFLINRGGIDNKNKFGETPLCVAFKEGQDFELVEYLIRRDAHLFTKDELGLYPWCYAILENSKYTSDEQMCIMKYLQDLVKLKAPETEQKISFESDQKRKEVARKLKFFQKHQGFISKKLEMYIALKSNNENWIKFLILHGADVNHESDGRMPLHIAIEFKRYKLAKMLLDHGAMFNVEDKSNNTPLQLLAANGDDSKESKEVEGLLETAKKLFDGNEKYSSQISRHLINCRDKQGQTLLHIAAKNSNLNDIKDIIKRSKNYCIEYKDFPLIDVNAKDAKGQTPLYLVKKNNVDIAKKLLVNGAIFEPATTPLLQLAKKLIQAVKDKDIGKVKELVKHECLVNAKDESRKSCLHYAAIFDCTEIIKILLVVKVSDVDAMDSNLQTPLHYAVENDNIECVVLLLKAGASYDVKNKQGIRPFDLADKTNESLKLMRKIHEMFVDIKSDEPRILNNENSDALIEYLSEIDRVWHVSKDIVVNVVDSKKNTLLHIATRYDFTLVVENLLRQGAIYNPKNIKKKSPDSMAISTKQLFRNASQMFHNYSVSSWVNLDPELVINLRTNNGYTLLHECARSGKKEEVRWLIENGADLKATSSRGFKIECNKKKYPEVYELLFQD